MKNMEEFIQQVRNHVCLWDTNSIFFRDVARKNAAWDAVAQESGLGDMQVAKALWKRLRDSHREAMRRRKVSPVLAPWKYEELMEFLLPPSNADFQIDNENDDASISEEDDIKTVDNENSQPRIASVQVQVKRDTSNFLDCIEERGKRRAEQERRRVELRNHAIDRNRHANNEGLRDLFSSLYHKTTQLPRQLQLRVQREVFEAVTKAEEEALAYEFPGPSSVEERRVALETEVAEIIVKEEKDDTILIS